MHVNSNSYWALTPGSACRRIGQRQFGSLFTPDFQVPGELRPEAIKTPDWSEKEYKMSNDKKKPT